MGETPEISGLWVLAGFNSAGIAAGGGAGEALAAWMSEGEMPFDLTAMDIRRFGPWANDGLFLKERVTETLGLHYSMAWPNREFVSARDRRVSPLHSTLAAAGACFGVKAGWERPLWFARQAMGCASEPVLRYGFGRPDWFGNRAFEQDAALHRAGLADWTSMGRLLVTGADAEECLSRVLAGPLAGVGQTTRSPWVNGSGCVESRPWVHRLEDSAGFLVLTEPGREVADAHWLRRHARSGGTVSITDVSTTWACCALLGPQPRGWHPGPAQPGAIHVHADCHGLGLTLVLAPSDRIRAAFEPLCSEVLGRGGALVGQYALDSLRVALGDPRPGAELGPEISPLEAGLGAEIDWTKNFIGRDALLARRHSDPPRRLLRIHLSSPAAMLWGGEPVWADGDCVGATSTAGSEPVSGCASALVLVRRTDTAPAWDDWVRAARFSVETAGRLEPARASLV